jgi:hypothetical protein
VSTDKTGFAGLSYARDITAERHYEKEMAAIATLSPERSQAEALKVIRRLAYSSWQQVYGTREMNERFESLWRMAFPEEEKGGKKL